MEKVQLFGVPYPAADWRVASHIVQNHNISPSPAPEIMLQAFYVEMVCANCCWPPAFIIFWFHEDCSYGDVRLSGGQSDSDGTVEVCYSNVWGLIEVSGWGENDAIVICRQLGLLTSGEYCNAHKRQLVPSNIPCKIIFSLCLSCCRCRFIPWLILWEAKQNCASDQCHVFWQWGEYQCLHQDINTTGSWKDNIQEFFSGGNWLQSWATYWAHLSS